MRTLVTGASGFIGSHLVEALLRRGHSVRALVRYRSTGSRGFLDEIPARGDDRLEVRVGDITDPFQVLELARGCDVVFHLAALIGIPYSYEAMSSYARVNVMGTLHVLEACRVSRVSRVLVTSTSEVYGTAVYTPIDEGHPLQAQSPYAATKIGADKLAEAYVHTFGLPVTIVRPFNVYGPRQSARAIIPAIASQLLAETPTLRLGALWPERDFTFVEDTIEAFLALSESTGAVGETVNVGSGTKISVGELAEMLQLMTGRHLPLQTDAVRLRPKGSEVGVLLADASKLRRMAGWRPRVGLQEGLRKTLDFIASRPDLYGPSTYQV